MTSTPPPCPECSGRHLRDLLYQHQTGCSRYESELSPREADHRTGRRYRLPTPAESDTIHELQYESPSLGEAYVIGVDDVPVYRRTVFGGEVSGGVIHEGTLQELRSPLIHGDEDDGQ